MNTASVIIATYNHATYLPDAINSAVNQTFADVEIIVIDDGSTDNTREVAVGFGESIHYVYQENRGLSAARNAGLVLARGRYITVLDADDILEPTYMEQMVQTLEQATDAGAVYCTYRMVDPDNRPLFQQGRAGVSPGKFYEALLDGNFIVPPCMLVKRKVYEEVGSFDESLTACEDWDMWLRIARNRTVLPLDASLVRYRVRPGSMSGDPQRMLANRLAVLKRQPLDLSSERYSRAVAYAYRITALEWIQVGDEDRALQSLKQAASHYPEALTELETYYELALWDQPKGSRGDIRKIDVQTNGRMLINLLDRFYGLPNLPDACLVLRKLAYARAYQALAILSYGRREMGEARAYFRHSLALSPSQLSKPGFAVTMLKSHLKTPLWPTRRPGP